MNLESPSIPIKKFICLYWDFSVMWPLNKEVSNIKHFCPKQELPSPVLKYCSLSMASSSSMSQYHVFLSFCSKDTGKTFTDHLYAALLDAGIPTFRDGGELESRQESAESELQRAIEGSRVVLVVFSTNYASSHRCLDGLVKALEWKKVSKLVIVPIFYDVTPSQVKNQTGSFEEAFAIFEQQQFSTEKVTQWRAALDEVANLGGMVLQSQVDRHESKFIQEIVKEAEMKLNRRLLNTTRYPIRLDSRVKRVNLWLQDGSTDVGIMTIYGIGGIGKSTIAKAAYNLNYDRFDGSSFLANIREAAENPDGLVRLQRQLLSNILNKKVKKIYNADEGIMKIKDAISCKKILVVLDDVDQLDQLNAVLGMRNWFYPGSKIIITTRHERLLKSLDACEMYEVKAFDVVESLQLFSWHAFGQDRPPEGFMKHSWNVVYHCGGMPLALQVLGSSLSDRTLDVWESALQKLRAIADIDIVGKLRISYDSLLDGHDQNLFLDIACFFVGKDKDYAVTVLDECNYYTIVGIQNLIDRCLITIDDRNKLLVHQLIQDMGREIIRQESYQPGRRSRIWSHKDSYNILRDKSGTESIKCLVLDMEMLKGVRSVRSAGDAKRQHSEEALDRFLLVQQSYTSKRSRLDFFGNAISRSLKIPDDVEFITDAFTKMQSLSLLKLSNVQITGCWEKFPKSLRLLYWRGFHLKSVPDDFPLASLVAIDMRNSCMTQVWKGIKFLGLLKILNLSHSYDLKRSPDFSGMPNLRRLILKNCRRLVELHESVEGLTRLVILNLGGCISLKRLPSKFGKLKSLEKLILTGCSKLNKLPAELGKMESLTVLHADDITIGQLASTTKDVVKSRPPFLWSRLSKSMKTPQSITFSFASFSRSLLRLSLSNCNLSDIDIPNDLRSLFSLRYLNLSGNPIVSLPQSIVDLNMLRDLWLDSCTSLQSLPELPKSLIDLKTVDCISLKRITNLPNLMDSLFMDVRGCEKLVEVQGLFRLEPITNFSAAMINDLGLLNLECTQNIEVELYNNMAKTRRKDVVQGLYEFGIFSTSFPGCEVPAWYSNKSMESSISFVVASDSNFSIRGLNVCIVYRRSSAKRFRFWSNVDWFTYYIKVNNKTKGLKWIYSPTFIGIPGGEENMTFLSHWKFGKQMENGDDVSVSVVCWSKAFRMKGLGVHLVNKQEEAKHNLSHPLYWGADDGGFFKYQLRTNDFFLSNDIYSMVGKSSDSEQMERIKAVLYGNLFEDSANVIDFTVGCGEGEFEDSDYDYPDTSDGEVGEEDDDDWLTTLL